MSLPVNPGATSARESARQPTGKFGAQPAADVSADVTLMDHPAVAPAAEYAMTPADAFRANRQAVVYAVADYDNDPSEANFWTIKTASLALESTLVDTDIPNDTFDELRHARQRAKNSPSGMKRLRSAIDDVSGYGAAVYGN